MKRLNRLPTTIQNKLDIALAINDMDEAERFLSLLDKKKMIGLKVVKE